MDPRMDPNRFTRLTFDCYGTLIDWETGILAALQPLFQRHGVTPEQILQRYVFHEARLEGMSWRPYRQVLAEVSVAMAADFQTELTGAEATSLAESVASWPPFTDTVAALRRLKDRYKLVIVSNVDDDLFAATARLLEVPFDDVITAQQVRSYKPATAHFHEALRRMDARATDVLHVAQSLYHDHEPAKRLGFHTAWVRRLSRLPVTGLAPASSVQVDLEVTTLDELARLLVLSKI